MKSKHCLLWTLALCAGFTLVSCDDDDVLPKSEVEQLADDQPKPAKASKGFWVVNEDWFGHSNGTVNYFKQQAPDAYEAVYRAYRAANPGEELGVTTQFGAVWNGNVYFVSKQGNRLVVADAQTLKKKAVLTDFGGDGRSFVGLTENKGYVGHAAGVAVLDLQSNTVKGQLKGVSGQVGGMALAGNRVFMVSEDQGVLVVNAETDQVEKTFEGDYHTLTVSRDGNVWVAGNEGLTRIQPVTLDTSTVAYPENGSISATWYAWNAGSLCASTQKNVLYWTGGAEGWGGAKKVFKYDIDAAAAPTVIYELGQSEDGQPLEFYGAGLRVDPLTDELVLTVKHEGWGQAGAFNWVYKLDNNGRELTHFAMKGDDGSAAGSAGKPEDWNERYYWFPALPVFEDANAPQILLNQVMLKSGDTVQVNLAEKVVDYDNTPASWQYAVAVPEGGLVDVTLEGSVLKVVSRGETGTATCRLQVWSNGVRAEKDIQLAVVE